ncbi:MAG: DMT family transporter [Candidatus Asgardarchaeia archaeon]
MQYMGLIWVVIFAIVNGISASIQKYGMMKLPKLYPLDFLLRPIDTFKTLFSSKYWLIGAISGFLGVGISFVVFSILDISLAYPLMNLNMIVVVLIGALFFKEKLSMRELFGISSMIIGAIILCFTIGDKSYNFEWSSMVIFIVVFSSVGILMPLISYLNKDSLFYSIKATEFNFSTSSGIFGGIANVFMNLSIIDSLSSPLNPLNIHDWFSIIKSIYFLPYVVTDYFSYALFQSAFSNGRASVVFSLTNSTGLLTVIFSSIFVFNEVFFLWPYFRPLGTFLILLGIFVLNSSYNLKLSRYKG